MQYVSLVMTYISDEGEKGSVRMDVCMHAYPLSPYS